MGSTARARLGKGAGPTLLATYLSLVVLLPVAALLAQGLKGGLGAFWSNITQPEAVAALELTLAIAAIVAVWNALAGTAIAWVLVRDRFPGKRVLASIIDLPFALPTVVAGLTLLSLYGPGSPFHFDVANTRLALALALAFVTLPFSVRSVQPVLAALDHEAEASAASLGATRLAVFRRIVLPGIAPAMVAGMGLSFARALGEFGSVVIISGNVPFHTEVASSWIFNLTQSGSLPAASAVAIALLVLASVVLLGLSWFRHRLTRRGRGAGEQPGPLAPEDAVRAAHPWPLRLGVAVYVALLIAVPLVSVVYRAFAAGAGAAWQAVTSPEALHALWLTLLVVLIAVPADTVFGVGMALLLSRHRFRGAGLLDAIVDLPLAMSPVVVGLALVLAYGKTGWFGNWLSAHGVHVIFSLPGIVIASAFVALPYVVRGVLPVLQQIGTEQEEAAATLGGGPLTVFRRITLPAIRQGLVYGVTLTTARVMGEFGAVAIVSGAVLGRTQTLTLFVQSSIENLNDVAAYATALLLALLSVGVLAILTKRRVKEVPSWESRSVPSRSGMEPLLSSAT